MADALSVLIDVAQRRLVAPRISMTAEKFGFNGLQYQNTWIEPVAGTVMLQPAPVNPSWHTSNAGIYARLSLSDFGLTASASGWNAVDNRGAGPVRLYNPTGSASTFSTTTTYTKNRSWFVSFYAYNVENKASAVYFECGWSNTGDGSVGVSLRFWASGLVEIYKDGVSAGSGNIGIQGGADTSNKYSDYLVIPFRKRDLLIYSLTSGDGFIHTFADIDDTDTNPTILAASKFWFSVPSGSINVELAPVQFPSSGYVTSDPISLSVPPPTGSTLETRANIAPATTITTASVFADSPYNGTVPDTTNVISAFAVAKTDGTAFTPDGTIRDVLMKVSMTGDGSYTPFLYGAHAAYGATFGNTDNAEQFDITPYILSDPPPTLSVPDDPGGVTFTFTIKSPETVESSDVPLLLTLGNRPCRVKVGANIILEGVMMEPEFDDACYDEAARLHCTVRDYMQIASDLQFRERIPLDGLALCDTKDATNFWKSIVQFMYYSAGINNADMDLDAVGFTLPAIPKDDQQEAYSAFVEIGSTPYTELARLVSTYASGFTWRMKPQPSGNPPKAIFKDPDALSTTPDYTLYRTGADALAAGKPVTDLYWSYSERPLAIEANHVIATGYNPKTKKVIQSYKLDAASQDPTTPPSSRPTNWVGEPIVFGIIDPRLTSQDACTKVVQAVYPKVTARHFISNITSEMLFKSDGSPVWVSDLIRCDGRRDIRVSAMAIQFIRETSTFVARNASYTGGAILNRGGITPTQISLQQLQSSVNKSFVFPGGELIAVQTPGTVYEVP